MSAEARQFFDAIARRYDRVYALSGDASRARLQHALEVLATPPGAKKVLVLGVGTGRELSRLLDEGHVPTGLDISTTMLALCNRRARPVAVVVADFWEALPFEAGAFEAVVALHGTVAHPPTPAGASVGRLADEIARVLTDDGVAFLEVPTRELALKIDAPISLPDGRGLSKLAEGVLLHEDHVVGVRLRAELLDRQEWEGTFASRFSEARSAAIGPGEISLVARTPNRCAR